MKLLLEALKYYGIKSIPGVKNNPDIVRMFHEINHSWVTDDDVAWCSAFINYCAKQAGIKFNGSLLARSWLNMGAEVKEPMLGDVAVFWRIDPNSIYGHVGIYINEADNNRVNILGGNQSGTVSIKPYEKSKLLGYRRVG